MDDKARDDSKDIALAAGNGSPQGIWGNDRTIWVSDDVGNKLFAYKRVNDPGTPENEYGTRDADSDFNTLMDAGNGLSRGIWSDGIDMFVVDTTSAAQMAFSYSMSDMAHRPARSFDLEEGNDHPAGIWSDGATLWVVDQGDDKLYAYGLPAPGQAQTQTTLWTATLTIKSLGSGTLGCASGNADTALKCSTNLTDTTFSYDNTNYTVEYLYLNASGILEFGVTTNTTDRTIAHLTLHIGSTEFALADASVSGPNMGWSSSGLSWTADTDVTVTLTQQSVAFIVSDVVVTSDPGPDDTYGLGATIELDVTFDQAVTVTGAPRIEIEVGGDMSQHRKWADYAGGSGTTTLRFAYVVQAADSDSDGIDLKADKLELNSGTIQNADGLDASLTYDEPGVQSGHKVLGAVEEQSATIWSATLTVVEVHSTGLYGCGQGVSRPPH